MGARFFPSASEGASALRAGLLSLSGMECGYKRIESIRNVVTLTARTGMHSGGYDMSELYT